MIQFDQNSLYGELIALRTIALTALRMAQAYGEGEATSAAQAATLEMCLNSARAYPLPSIPAEDATLIRGFAETTLMSVLTTPFRPMAPDGPPEPNAPVRRK